jgi:hypothetical protein
MEANLSLKLVKLLRIYLKLIPIVIAILSFVNCVLCFLGIESKILAHAFLFLLIGFVYIASYVLKFCEYHRISLHYIVIIYIINCYDYYIGIPINYIELFMMYSMITFLAIIVGIYLKLKHI